MRGSHLLLTGVALGIFATILFAGQKPSPPPARWEYAVYITGLGQDLEGRMWQAGAQHAWGDDLISFCKRMGIPSPGNVRQDTYAKRLAVEAVILDNFGEQGWLMVSAPDKQRTELRYVFKRAK